MGFISVKVFGLFYFFPLFVFDFAFVLYPLFGTWVMRFFAMLLPYLVFIRVYICNAVDTVYDLNTTKLYSS